MLTDIHIIDIGMKARRDSRKWRESKGTHSPDSLDTFEDGFVDGWDQCLRMLKDHGYKFERLERLIGKG